MALILASPAAAVDPPPDAVSSYTYSRNLHPLGHSARNVPLENASAVDGIYNSDLAFWGRTAYQGTYEGFRIIDVTDPENPVEINNYDECAPGVTTGNQGDLVVWGDIVVRSWNSAAPAAGTATCDGEPVLPGVFGGFEGLHVFDVSDPLDPDLVASVETECGSHTASGVPDLANNRLLIYNSPSSGGNCSGIDIVEVPLDDPSSAAYLRFESSGDVAAPGLPYFVTVDLPSAAAGSYGAAGAAFGPDPTVAGIAGAIVAVNDGAGLSPTDGCEPFSVPAGTIALVDRGNCNFTVKVAFAQASGAVAVIVVNNAAGTPTEMGGTDPTITIPAVQVSQSDGATIRAGLPATGSVSAATIPDRSCHDTGVILGSALRAACAGGDGFSVWSLDSSDGGSLEDPAILYSRSVAGVTIGHSASFSWDGATLIFGHEPGGGTQARCQATSAQVDRTLFFFDAATGATLGTFIHPRPQTATENCTWHNYNVVPTAKRDILVSGNYQAGISVLDFTDPANVRQIAFADPAPLLNPDNPAAIEGGGDWSSYWYDGRIYESDMTRGLTIWELADKNVAGAMKLGHLNPQTQEFTIP